MTGANIVQTRRETVRVLRAIAEDTRRTVQICRDRDEYSWQETPIMSQPKYEHTSGTDHSVLSRALVQNLVQAHDLAEADGDPQTRALLSRVLVHVGHRILGTLDPVAAKIITH